MITTPYINICGLDTSFLDFHREYLLLCKEVGHPPVQGMKKRLGQQNYTFTGHYRYWVWESEAHGWRVYVSNLNGIGFEVVQEFTLQQARVAWSHFLSVIRGS